MELQHEIYTIESTKRPVNEYADTHWSILHKHAPMSLIKVPLFTLNIFIYIQFVLYCFMLAALLTVLFYSIFM